MIRRLLRLLLYLFIAAVVLVVAAVLLKDTLLKELMQRRIRHATGMDARIGQVEVGVLSPEVTIEDLKLYNSPAFGGSLCLSMPELHMEYDPDAMRTGKLRFPLIRLNLAEVDVVQNRKGRLNFDVADQKSDKVSAALEARHLEFAGIDTLNLTLGALRWKNLATGNTRVYQIGVTNQVFHHVKSEADLAVLMALTSAAGATNASMKFSDFLRALIGPAGP